MGSTESVFLADLCNLLDGSAKVAIQTFTAEEWTPAPDSQVDREMRAEVMGRAGVPWDRTPRDTAFTHATLPLYAAAENLGSIADLVKPPMTMFGAFILARASIEGSARSWWMLDPALDIEDRVHRGVRERWAVVCERISLLEEMEPGELRSDPAAADMVAEYDRNLAKAAVRKQDVLDTAWNLRVPIHRKDGVVIGVDVQRPASSKVVGDLLAAVGFRIGAGLYSWLSQLNHSSASSLSEFFQTGREVSPDVYEWRPEVPASLLQNVLHVTLLAFLEAFDRLVFLYGWDDGPWSSWRTHVKKKIVTGPRVQVQ